MLQSTLELHCMFGGERMKIKYFFWVWFPAISVAVISLCNCNIFSPNPDSVLVSGISEAGPNWDTRRHLTLIFILSSQHKPPPGRVPNWPAYRPMVGHNSVLKEVHLNWILNTLISIWYVEKLSQTNLWNVGSWKQKQDSKQDLVGFIYFSIVWTLDILVKMTLRIPWPGKSIVYSSLSYKTSEEYLLEENCI